MKKCIRNLLIAASCIALFCTPFLGTGRKAYAISAAVNMSPSKTAVDIGETFTVSYSISPSEGMAAFQGNVSQTGGVDLVGGTCSVGQFAGNTFLYFDVTENLISGASGSLTLKATHHGDQTVTMTVLVTGKNSQDRITVTRSVNVHVRTTAETQKIRDDAAAASKAEAERLAAERASREAAERASREQQERENAIIASKQAEEASKKASQDAITNSSIAESASIADSIRESEYESESVEESIRESVKASESEAERTKATEIEDLGYALLQWGKILGTEEKPEYEHRFFMAVSANDLKIPKGYKAAELTINDNPVLALKKDGMNPDTYLIYGMSEKSEEPAWYFYNEKEHSFFPYDYLFSDTVFEEHKGAAEENGTLNGEMKRDMMIDLGFTGLIGVLIGVFITMLAKPGRYTHKKDGNTKTEKITTEDTEE